MVLFLFIYFILAYLRVLIICRRARHPIEEIASRLKEGPLVALQHWYAHQQRVRVVTRHNHGIRGVAHGTLVAVDKHWNMVLKQVEEEYSVLIRMRRKERWVRKQEKRRRLLKQAFLVGNTIVMVSLDGH
jgi:small nuclear ribonucleoprotein (snRNP)-like protein